MGDGTETAPDRNGYKMSDTERRIREFVPTWIFPVILGLFLLSFSNLASGDIAEPLMNSSSELDTVIGGLLYSIAVNPLYHMIVGGIFIGIGIYMKLNTGD